MHPAAPHACSKAAALAEQIGSFSQSACTSQGWLVSPSSASLAMADAACIAATAFGAVGLFRSQQLSDDAAAAARAAARSACSALDAGAAALRHTSQSGGRVLGRPAQLNTLAKQLSWRVHTQLRAASLLCPLAYHDMGVALAAGDMNAHPIAPCQGRWVLAYSLAFTVLYTRTEDAPDAPGGREIRSII